jgi:hypothetical protein
MKNKLFQDNNKIHVIFSFSLPPPVFLPPIYTSNITSYLQHPNELPFTLLEEEEPRRLKRFKPTD